jgi:hypothetical protein
MAMCRVSTGRGKTSNGQGQDEQRAGDQAGSTVVNEPMEHCVGAAFTATARRKSTPTLAARTILSGWQCGGTLDVGLKSFFIFVFACCLR